MLASGTPSAVLGRHPSHETPSARWTVCASHHTETGHITKGREEYVTYGGKRAGPARAEAYALRTASPCDASIRAAYAPKVSPSACGGSSIAQT